MPIKTLLRALQARPATPAEPKVKTPVHGPTILNRGQSWWSENERVALRLDMKGVLSILHDGKWVWSAPTKEKATRLVMQNNGQLALYAGYECIWWAGADNRPDAELRLQDDGNVVLYDHNVPKWSAGTHV